MYVTIIREKGENFSFPYNSYIINIIQKHLLIRYHLMKSCKEKYRILEEILDLLMTIKRINLGMNLSTHILGSNTKYKFRNLVGQRTVNWLTMLIMYLCSYHWREGIQYSSVIFINTISYYEELQRENLEQ